MHLVLASQSAGKHFDIWLPPMEDVGDNANAPYQFEAKDLKLGHFTGLQVSHEPGQWGVWSGVVLMGLGLAFVFYVVHMRFWALPLRDPKTGKFVLWMGGSANRNRDAFEQRFNDLAATVETELKSLHKLSTSEKVATVA